MKQLFTLLFSLSLLLVSTVLFSQTSYTSSNSGSWSTSSNWNPSGVPEANDNVTISSGHTITIDQNISVASLTVGTADQTGTLKFENNTTVRNVTISGDVTVSANGTFITQDSETATHTMSIGGNLINGNIFDMSQGGTTLTCEVTFNKDGNQTISGSGGTTRFNKITLNMGATNINTLEVTADNFSASNSFLTVTNGTFKLTSNVTVNASTANLEIPATGGLWINGGTLSIGSSNGSLIMRGLLYLDAGVLNVGSKKGNQIENRGIIKISNGTLNISGRWLQISGGDAGITGGTINVSTAGQTSSGTIATFQVPGSNPFSMSGGEIILHNANDNISGGDLKITNSSANITGGTITIGQGSSTVGNISIVSSAPLYNLKIDAGSTAPYLIDNLTITNNLQVNSGSFEINPLKSLTVNGSLTNNVVATSLIVKSDATGTGSLIHNTASVPATIERYVAAAVWETASNGWHLLSSPVASQSISGNWIPTGAGNDYDMQIFDETKLSDNWLNQKVGDNNINTFETGKGYLVAYQQSATKTFAGNVNVVDASLSGLTNTATSAFSGWHLVGNPFASAIDYDIGSWIKTNIDQEIQVWNSVTASYKTATEVSGIIPAMNGFMVHTTGSGVLTIPADARANNAANWYKSDEEFILLKANDLETNMSQSSIIRFNSMATDTYDIDFDSYFLQGFAPAFYSTSANEIYALNTLPEISNELVIPFGFIKNESASFSIELAKSVTAAIVYLTDNKTNTITNLSEAGSYNFTASDGDNANRFLLHFGAVGIDEQDQPTRLNAYTYNNRLYANNSLQKAQLAIYDLQGRLVAQQAINEAGLQSLPLDLPAGIYVLQLSNTQEAQSVKINVQ